LRHQLSAARYLAVVVVMVWRWRWLVVIVVMIVAMVLLVIGLCGRLYHCSVTSGKDQHRRAGQK
jgi:ABC-type multidrug transport system permease subunit